MVANCFIDITGKQFGWLTVLDHAGSDIRPSGKHYALWRCKCTCGQEVLVHGQKLRQGRRKACGINGHLFRAASLRKLHPAEYRTFEGIYKRCSAKSGKHYRNYSSRNIKICKRWHSFRNFLADMGPRPEGLTIERIDNDGDYEPGNCRWATTAEQNRNKRQSVFIEYQGERMLLMDLCAKLGLRRENIYQRLKLGWSLADALLIPMKKYKLAKSKQNG